MNILKLFFLVILSLSINGQKNLNLGFIFVKTDSENGDILGFTLAVGIIPVVIDRITSEKLLPQYNFTFNYYFDDCIEKNSSGLTYQLIVNDKVDVIFGPSCSINAIRASMIAKFYNKPIFIWGLVSSTQFTNVKRFPNVYSVAPVFYSLALTVLDILKTFNWHKYVFFSCSRLNNRCNMMFDDFVNAANIFDFKAVMVYSYKASTPPLDIEYDAFINETIIRARIIITCFDRNDWKRSFLLKMYDRGLNNSEYVHINMEDTSKAFNSHYVDSNDNPIPFYNDVDKNNDGRDMDAFEMAKRMFIFDTAKYYNTNKSFDKEVIKRVNDWPFYCNVCNINDSTILNRYARYLGDSVYIWATLLNKTLDEFSEKTFENPTLFRKQCLLSKEGYTGIINFDSNCIRLPTIQVTGLDKFGKQIVWFNYSYTSLTSFKKESSVSLNNFPKTIFENWNNSIPLTEPICGYLHNRCQKNFFKFYFKEVIIVGVIILILILFIIIGLIWYICKVKVRKGEELNKWKISLSNLISDVTNNDATESIHSSVSEITTNTFKFNLQKKNNTENYSFYLYNDEEVVGRKYKNIFNYTNNDCLQLNKIISINHENLNKFFGICIDGTLPISVWKYCKRGSLHEILQTDIPNFDSYFMMSLTKDIYNGLSYIHSSFINFHGTLNSKICFVSDRWQVKISNFSTKQLSAYDKTNIENLLWRAPEHLTHDFSIGSKEGDIYSFGIILSEIISKGNFWNLSSRQESVEELIYLLKRGNSNDLRPEIIVAPNVEVNPSFITLIKDCWNYDDKKRPNIKQIEKLLNVFTKKNAKNLMDHVFKILEKYSLTLQDEINDRTKEIVEEQKKSDILLKKMLPAEIVEKLKLGKTVEPENYDNVTVFFADIVKFTILSSKCSAFQVVTLVNDLFILFDNLIESLDIYKVETIGDGYLCVSGLPTRNGDMHGKQIAELSLGFNEICHKFSIPYLPGEKIMVRIGCNSGPCVAGVVGLAMPRYCLFGDTVNTASRMESNGKPERIHITESCSKLLNKIGGYVIEPRGEVIIKGKGVMNTFWLNGRIGENNNHMIKNDEVKFEPILNLDEKKTNTNMGMYREFGKNNN
ncbi:Atrial natriuretic peptide receptor 1 [Strongyloides ratti]|uniref:Guanylate cyclase n=1 Tax=Strongyloides ratti TaxID=34506 RepID=A0A090N6B6_STRRB|nr:Atrial natriuretic peptide receptor 1 [Strongyloides ratti]CEG06140.1 Atrial natriuretic peptide receptor 1 [Strongyloides ratti]